MKAKVKAKAAEFQDKMAELLVKYNLPAPLNRSIISFEAFKDNVEKRLLNKDKVPVRDIQVYSIDHVDIDRNNKIITIFMDENVTWAYKVLVIDLSSNVPKRLLYKSYDNYEKDTEKKCEKPLGLHCGHYKFRNFGYSHDFFALETLICVCLDIEADQLLNTYDNLCCNVKSGTGDVHTKEFLNINVDYFKFDDLEYCDMEANLIHGKHIKPLYRLLRKVYMPSAYDYGFNSIYNLNINGALGGDQTSKQNIIDALVASGIKEYK